MTTGLKSEALEAPRPLGSSIAPNQSLKRAPILNATVSMLFVRQCRWHKPLPLLQCSIVTLLNLIFKNV